MLDYFKLNKVLARRYAEKDRLVVVFYKHTVVNIRKYRNGIRGRDAFLFLSDRARVQGILPGLKLSGIIILPDAEVDVDTPDYTLIRLRRKTDVIIMVQEQHEAILEQALEPWSKSADHREFANAILMNCYCNEDIMDPHINSQNKPTTRE